MTFILVSDRGRDHTHKAVFSGKDGAFNHRFSRLMSRRFRGLLSHRRRHMSHHLIELTACTPSAGCEKRQSENQVGFVRKRFFSPRLKFKSYAELNARLADRCIVLTQTHPHPIEKERRFPRCARRSGRC